MSTSLSSLGGPSSVTVDIDKGVAGIPGTQFYLSFGDPNTPENLPGVTPRRYDICTNIDPADAEYLFLYQYNYVINPDTGFPVINPITGEPILAWIPGFKLIPNSIARNESAVFVNGQTQITFDIELPSDYSAGPGGVPENFDLQFEITNEVAGEDQAPNAAIHQIIDLSLNENIATVTIGFGGIELVDGLWIPISGNRVIHLIITVV